MGMGESNDSGDSGRTRVVTTRHDASRSPQQPLPPTTTTEGPHHPPMTTTDKDLDISRKISPAPASSFRIALYLKVFFVASRYPWCVT